MAMEAMHYLKTQQAGRHWKLITLPTQSLCSHIVSNQSELEIPDLRGDKLLNPKKKTLNKNFKI